MASCGFCCWTLPVTLVQDKKVLGGQFAWGAALLQTNLYDKIICCRWRHSNKPFCSSSIFYIDFLTPAFFSCTGELPFNTNIFPWENLLGNNSVFFNQVEVTCFILLSFSCKYFSAALFIFLPPRMVNSHNMDGLYRSNILSSLKKTSKIH